MKQIVTLLEGFIERGAFPGAAFCFGTADRFELGFAGRVSSEEESHQVDESTWWDLASLTKIMATTPLAMIAVEEGRIQLNDPVGTYLPESRVGKATIRHLLSHTSGLRAYLDVTSITDVDAARGQILVSAPESAPGVKTMYSCLGFVQLMVILERVYQARFDALLADKFLNPARINADFRPASERIALCAPTEETPHWRRKLAKIRGEETGPYIQGVVHDPLAYVLGGVSGNAGLFAPIAGVARYLQLLTAEDSIFGSDLPEWRQRAPAARAGSTRALGFDTKSATGSSAGLRFGPRTFGHTGYTGTAAWIDPEAGIFAALLTNRVHPRDGNMLIAEARPAYFNLAFEAAHNV